MSCATGLGGWGCNCAGLPKENPLGRFGNEEPPNSANSAGFLTFLALKYFSLKNLSELCQLQLWDVAEKRLFGDVQIQQDPFNTRFHFHERSCRLSLPSPFSHIAVALKPNAADTKCHLKQKSWTKTFPQSSLVPSLIILGPTGEGGEQHSLCSCAGNPLGSVCSARLDIVPCAGADGMLSSSSKLLRVFLLGLLYQILGFVV